MTFGMPGATARLAGQSTRGASVAATGAATLLSLVLGLVAIAVPLALYLGRLAPGVLYGDQGDVQVQAQGMGIAHPPGYAVLMLLGRLVNFAAVGTPAWRMNALSALLGAVCVLLAYGCIAALVGLPLPALVGALLLAVSGLFWYQSLQAGNATLETALVLGVALALWRWQSVREIGAAYAACLLLGLAVANNPAMAILLPALIVALALGDLDEMHGASGFGLCLICFIIGLLPLGYVYLADQRDVAMSFMRTAMQSDPHAYGLTAAQASDPVQRLLALIEQRGQAGTISLGARHVLSQAGIIMRNVVAPEFGPMGLALMGLGIVTLAWVSWRGLLTWLLLFATLAIPPLVFVPGGQLTTQVLDSVGWPLQWAALRGLGPWQMEALVPVMALLAVLAGAGAGGIFLVIAAIVRLRPLHALLAAVLFFVLLALPVLLSATPREQIDMSAHTSAAAGPRWNGAESWARATMRAVPAHARVMPLGIPQPAAVRAVSRSRGRARRAARKYPVRRCRTPQTRATVRSISA